jgi:hypothetical protein
MKLFAPPPGLKNDSWSAIVALMMGTLIAGLFQANRLFRCLLCSVFNLTRRPSRNTRLANMYVCVDQVAAAPSALAIVEPVFAPSNQGDNN